ncbi:MAG: alanine--tRNA ligase [Aeromonadales bacterium]|nr:alanine--tRNA ligase [Aeromonadales bacterium]MDY2890634.1 alanine--tRNA ligase [Succinivibrio sp.]
MYMTTDQIRQKYLDFFRERGHTVVRSSSLVPHNDPTLLFTNAGMNQFKDVYLGKEKRPYVRACSAQKCVRAGGKQNDLENVGYTARHHTFFEMLGNFSFGDYFKKEAITYAWTLLTEGYGLPKESLTVTVYDKDDEAYNIWKDVIGVPPERIIRIGDNKGGPFESDNFWQMGDTGPCGPCSEIFYDHGEGIWGGPPGSAEEDGDRYIEIWNIVFMQYNRKADGSFEKLGKPMIDNGLGLERIAAVLQGVHNNYDIDLFVNLEKDAARVLGVDDLKNKSLRVIADHIRSCSFLIADGVLPSNEGRGYVLRRIIRRAVRHGRLLGAKDVFFYKLVDRLAELMGHAYPELIEEKDLIKRTLKKEEELFLKTLDRGLFLLEGELNKLGASKVIPGDVVFKLYDTYGFPTDLTADVVRDRGYTLDMDGFDAEMAKQRANSKKNSRFDVDYNKDIKVTEVTKFTGYDTLQSDATVTGIYKDGAEVDSVSTDEKAVLILDSTPFYGEMGGQVGDHGSIKCGENTEFIVEDTKRVGKTIIHIGRVELGEFTKGMKVTACVDPQVRRNIAAHHTATHLLDAALRQTLGNDVVQKGSYVGPDRLHYDYSYSQPLTLLERQKVGALINKWIRQNDEVRTEIMDLDAAKKSGAIALFDEKYEDKVRVVSMGDESKELCGGTHASRTGDLGVFVLVSDESVASGIRRIEARVGQAAIDYLQGIVRMVVKTAKLMKADNLSIAEKTEALLAKGKAMEKENEALKAKVISYEAEKLCQKAVEINGVKLVAARLEGYDPKDLRTAAEDVVVRLKSGVALLGAVNDGKVSLTAAVSKDLTSKVKAGDLVREAAGYVGGKGGGRPDLAQAGGTKAEGLDEAIASVGAFLKAKA